MMLISSTKLILLIFFCATLFGLFTFHRSTYRVSEASESTLNLSSINKVPYDELSDLFYSNQTLSSGLFIPVDDRVNVLNSCREYSDPYIFGFNETVPVFLISYERPRALKMALAALSKLQDPIEIIVLDFGSVGAEMTKFLDALQDVEVVREKNYGMFKNFEVLARKVDLVLQQRPKVKFFVVSDPDITLASNADLIKYYATFLTACPGLPGIGPALNLIDLPSYYPLREGARKWESQFWVNPSPVSWHGVSTVAQEAPIDTTFFMSRRGKWNRLVHGIRTSYPYSAHHTDWYLHPRRLTQAEFSYASTSTSNWAKIFAGNSFGGRPVKLASCADSAHPTWSLSSGWDQRAENVSNTALVVLANITEIEIVKPTAKKDVVFRVLGNSFWTLVNSGTWGTAKFKRLEQGIDEGTTLVDFGTWIGPTILFGAQFAERTFGIEADPAAFAEVTQNLNLNRHLSWARSVHLQSACVGTELSIAEMKAREPGKSTSSLSLVHGNTSKYLKWSVQCYTLPYLFQIWEIDPEKQKVFVKVDIESAECNVVSSWFSWLSSMSRKPTLHLALHSQIHECSIEEYELLSKIAKLYKFHSPGMLVSGSITRSGEGVLSDAYQPD